MRTYITIAVAAVFIIGAGTIIARSGSYAPSSGSSGTGTGATTDATSGKTYTMAQVAAHNSGTSCWTAINGKVYDVTDWINQHPGGAQAILSLCGIDGSSAFNAQHGGQRRPASELAGFLIGSLSGSSSSSGSGSQLQSAAPMKPVTSRGEVNDD